MKYDFKIFDIIYSIQYTFEGLKGENEDRATGEEVVVECSKLTSIALKRVEVALRNSDALISSESGFLHIASSRARSLFVVNENDAQFKEIIEIVSRRLSQCVCRKFGCKQVCQPSQCSALVP